MHASKGLQAPIVYLPDTTRVPRDAERLLAGADGEARLWLPRTDDANEAARAWRAEARERALEEQNRLLYVAMTRAEDRLYVGGWVGATKPDRGCWYERIEAGLRASSEGESPRIRAAARPRRATHLRLRDASSATKAGRATATSSPTPADIEVPEQAELALEAAAAAGSLGAPSRAGRARSADTAGAVATAAGRGAREPARLQPAGAGRLTALAARPAAARAAAPPAGAAAGRRAPRQRAASSRSRRTA